MSGGLLRGLAAVLPNAPNPADCPEGGCPYFENESSLVLWLVVGALVVVAALLVMVGVRRARRRREEPPVP